VQTLALTNPAQFGNLDLRALICLPEGAGVDVETCQPPISIGQSINAHRMPEVERSAAPLLGMSADHATTRTMGWRAAERLPKQHVVRLFCQRQRGIGIGVNEKIPFRNVKALAGLQELPVSLGYRVQSLPSIGFERRVPSGV